MSRCDVGFGVRFTVVRECARTRLGIDKTLSSNPLSLAPLYTYIQLIPTHSNYLSLVLARYAWRHTDLEGFGRYSCVASQSHSFTSTQSHTWDVSRLVCRVSHLPSSAESGMYSSEAPEPLLSSPVPRKPKSSGCQVLCAWVLWQTGACLYTFMRIMG